jgi:non-heme chloroperoxidase
LPHAAIAASAEDVKQPAGRLSKGVRTVSMITTKDDVEIFYKDCGTAQAIVFSHGWPLSADDWDAQMLFFLSHGYRVPDCSCRTGRQRWRDRVQSGWRLT